MTFKTLLILFVATPFFVPPAFGDMSGNTDRTDVSVNEDKVSPEERLQRTLIEVAQSAESRGTPPEGMGFWKPDHVSLPAPVRKSAQSAFILFVPSGRKIKASEILKNRTYSAALRKLASVPNSRGLGLIEKEIYRFQISECARRARPKNKCEIYETVTSTSAFATGDGRDVRTALQAVRHLIADARNNGWSGSLPIAIISPNRTVLGPQDLQARISALPSTAFGTQSRSRKYRGPTPGTFNGDQVVIRSKKVVAAPIAIASRPLSADEQAYIVGVPRKTSDRQQFRAEDADGYSVRISQGTVLSAESLLERLRASGFEGNLRTATAFLREGTALTADSTSGMTGGAILNSRGEAVGIYAQGVPYSGSAHPLHVSYGSNWLVKAPRNR